ncbi:hypothetical protein DITRI_Ditri06bG0048600 [Diplodiscus trichospermus]
MKRLPTCLTRSMTMFTYPQTIFLTLTYLLMWISIAIDRRWNRWKVKLRKKYFHTQWDWVLLSIFAATILLLLTSVQTVFSVLAYFKTGN